ncbi:MAG: DUF4129 domain-containing protein [Anaerolineae bacterium]|nr:MAG: DUF4129 domain-containing protein [Anaerolineae bacterium]
MRWNRWNWLDDGALPLAMVILRFCWLWPWLALAQRWLAPSCPGTLVSAWPVFGLLLGGLAMTRWALKRASTLAQARVGVAGLGLAVVLSVLWWQLYRPQFALGDAGWVDALGQALVNWHDGVPPPVFALLAAAYLWLRGVQDGHKRPLVREDVWKAFMAGIVALVAIVLASAAGADALPDDTGHLVLLFFATGLAALALTSLEIASRSAGRRFESELRLDRYWLGSVASVIVGLLGLGLLLGALIAPETVAQVLNGIWGVVRQVLIFLIMIVSLLLSPFLYLLSVVLTPLLRRLFELLSRLRLNLPDLSQLWGLEAGGEQESLSIIERVPEGLRWIVLALLLLAIGFLFARALRRLLAGEGEEGGIEEVRELILSRNLLRQQLARLWRDWLNWLRRQPHPAFSPFLSLEGEPPTRRAVRAVYQALLAAARERGLPRMRHQTPAEYRHGLEAGLPTEGDALAVITEGYMQARYDAEPPAVEQARRVLQAWEQLEGELTPEDSE